MTRLALHCGLCCTLALVCSIPAIAVHRHQLGTNEKSTASQEVGSAIEPDDDQVKTKSNNVPAEEKKHEQKEQKKEADENADKKSDAAPRLEVVEDEGRVIGYASDMPKMNHTNAEKKRKESPSPMEDAGLVDPQEEPQEKHHQSMLQVKITWPTESKFWTPVANIWGY